MNRMPRKQSAALKKGNRSILYLLVAFTSLGFAYPYLLRTTMKGNMLQREGELPANTKIRGAFMNSGSKDVGRTDPHSYRKPEC